jgi:hypothetical protein
MTEKGVAVTELHVSAQGLQAASATLGAQAGATTGGVIGLSASSTQASVTGVQDISAQMRNWQTDESGYHQTMANTLSSASQSYENTDAHGGQSISGVM